MSGPAITRLLPALLPPPHIFTIAAQSPNFDQYSMYCTTKRLSRKS
jgi:hypothetical protein